MPGLTPLNNCQDLLRTIRLASKCFTATNDLALCFLVVTNTVTASYHFGVKRKRMYKYKQPNIMLGIVPTPG